VTRSLGDVPFHRDGVVLSVPEVTRKAIAGVRQVETDATRHARTRARDAARFAKRCRSGAMTACRCETVQSAV
jgi:hypothetical protein